MRKTIFILFSILISNLLFSQSQWDNYNVTSSQNEIINDIKFVNANTGYSISKGNGINGTNCYLHKTTNGGLNWTDELVLYSYTGYPPCLDFIDANTGFIAVNNIVYLTTNGGINFYNITSGLSNRTNMRITGIKFYDNSHAFVISNDKNIYDNHRFVEVGKLTASTSSGYQNTWQYGNYSADAIVNLSDIDVYNNGSIYAIVCGKYKYGDTKHSICIYTSGGFQSATTVLPERLNVAFDHVSFYPNSSNFKLLGTDGIYYYSSFNTQPELVAQLGTNNFDLTNHGLKFISSSTGYAAINDGKIYKTTNGGYSWLFDNADFGTSNSDNLVRNRLTNLNDIIYYGDNVSRIWIRRLGTIVYTNFEYIPLNGSIYLNGQSFNTNSQNPQINLKGGNVNATAYLNLANPQLSQEAYFYKWGDNKLNQTDNYYITNENTIITANYKTRNISTDANAIKNVTQTKTFRDSAGNQLFQIHQSLGGIFFSYTYSPTTPLESEQIVNSGAIFNEQFPNDNTAEGNKNPSICEIKNFYNSPGLLPINYRIASTWERYNSETNKQQIFSALKVDQVNSPWLRYGSNPESRDGIVKEFTCTNPNFDSKPEIITAYKWENGDQTNPYNYFYIIPHLEPASSGNKLAVTVRYKNGSAYDQNLMINEPQDNTFILEPDNVTDFAVEGSQYDYVTNANQPYFYLHFAYKKGDNILYRREKFILDFSYNPPRIDRYYDNEWYENGGEYYIFNLSESSDVERVNPDISLKNGKPIVTYRGKISHKEIVHYEEGEDQIFPYYTFPVYVKTQINNTSWGETFSYSSTSVQEIPDIEGSKDAGAYIINFQRSNLFKKFVKVDYVKGYLCNPEDFYGSDSKIAKGSYRGTTGASSNPTLLTLSYPGNAQYTIGVQNFSIVNSSISTNEDGFSNLSGSIEKNNANYIYNLGPIFVSNTVCGFNDDNPSITIHNPVDFNDNMKSKGFYLSDNDTLIIGATGYYKPINQQLSVSMKYHVNLVTKSTNQIFRELFRDTVKVKDSINLEFLRGYIIKGISNGSDSFYVQLLVDPNDAISDNYDLCGVYQDPGVEADNISRFKTKVFFENESLQNNIVNNVPTSFELSQNYPNPFNPTTTIKYALPKNEFVTIKIYDIVGREIMQLVSEYKQAGYHTVNFNGGNMASGVYFYRIQAGDFVNVKRMVLIK